jgi:hypothetical protein
MIGNGPQHSFSSSALVFEYGTQYPPIPPPSTVDIPNDFLIFD